MRERVAKFIREGHASTDDSLHRLSSRARFSKADTPRETRPDFSV
jgi:hypothetical protein